MTAGGMPVWSLLKPLGLLALLVALGRGLRQPHGRSVGTAEAQGAGGAGAHRLDEPGHPALAVHLAGSQPHGAYSRPGSQRRAARADDARRARSQAGRHLPGRARPDHQAGRPRPICAWRRATSSAASRTRPPRRSSPSSATRWTSTSSSNARPGRRPAPARAIHGRAPEARPERTRLQDESRQLHLRAARALRQSFVCVRVCSRWCWRSWGRRRRRARSRTRAVDLRLRRRRVLPCGRHYRRQLRGRPPQHGGRALRPCLRWRPCRRQS